MWGVRLGVGWNDVLFDEVVRRRLRSRAPLSFGPEDQRPQQSPHASGDEERRVVRGRGRHGRTSAAAERGPLSRSVEPEVDSPSTKTLAPLRVLRGPRSPELRWRTFAAGECTLRRQRAQRPVRFNPHPASREVLAPSDPRENNPLHPTTRPSGHRRLRAIVPTLRATNTPPPHALPCRL